MSVVHRESHRVLLHEFSMGTPRPVDAIVVPAGRPAQHLHPAAQLASELGCVLLVMCCPDGADPDVFGAVVDRAWPDLRWHPLHVPEDYTHVLLPRTASPKADSDVWRHGPLSTMRNLALLLARMLGWQTVLLVDDDIVGLDQDLVRTATCGLDRQSAVALTVDSYPDNSVVCHANRLAGHQQDVFVGACALLLDTTRPFGFFPNIYNEDWFFLYDEILHSRVTSLDRVRQLPYDPYHRVARAIAEEFGDVIAEGLMAGLHGLRRRIPPPTDLRYWRGFLEARQAFIERAAVGLRAQLPTVENRAALDALEAAEERRSAIAAEDCASFVRDWRRDLGGWRRSLADLETFIEFEDAAGHLGLTGSLAVVRS